ncbi:hypothetical protein HaLaN_14325 [Haematococcus lacustris]|uniref:Uncharacterized protein n=1 Tax=Haematococcus lacustris TaxID=44745 RepID=A0A699Z4T8_HAELA|nr:hypothetical protein HaLaN_14325 [Haematococcus lacustris]
MAATRARAVCTGASRCSPKPVRGEKRQLVSDSGVPNMGLVIFMQVLSQYCIVFDGVCHIVSRDLVRGI